MAIGIAIIALMIAALAFWNAMITKGEMIELEMQVRPVIHWQGEFEATRIASLQPVEKSPGMP